MIKKFVGKITSLSLYADNRYRITIEGESGYFQLVCSQEESHSFQSRLDSNIQAYVELGEEEIYANSK